MNSKRILLTGGGTAGHVTPNIALIETLKDAGWCIECVGSRGGIEKTLIEPLVIPFHEIASGKLRRYLSWQNFVDPFFVIWGVFQSLYLCMTRKPNIVFSKGGFVSVPLVVAAWLRRIPVICHESDITPGLANKICFPFSAYICVSFPQTENFLPKGKTVITGTPIRAALLNGNAKRGRDFLGFSHDKKILLVFGGSLGSEVINQCVRRALPELLVRYQVVHVAGKGNVDSEVLEDKSDKYRQFEYLNDEFGDVLAAADHIISRAGANTIYELILSCKPHILIPLTRQASRGDQIVNARICQEEGMSKVIQEENLSKESLLRVLDELEHDEAELKSALNSFEIKNATELICSLITETAR
ncbi:MAG: undecaprenyldiphospho-muramoylpentapeptide beta-N-acetylglucosaminyltransferase [Pseudomonadales bacterium]|nr:undecaprenyldiphospho-muramoylpentapeptide beta-N-acetylglucosaminyltransferase [Pseudomonadales bacterium]